MADRQPGRREDSGEGANRALPELYYLDESDPDILVLRRRDGTFVAAFSAMGASWEGIVRAANEDYEALQARLPKKGGSGEGPDPTGGTRG